MTSTRNKTHEQRLGAIHTRVTSGAFAAIVFFVLSAVGAGLQPAHARDSALDLAEYLAEAGNYEGAVIELKRFVCFNPQSPMLNEVFLRMSQLLARENEWAEALEAAQKSIDSCNEDSVADERRISRAVLLIASRDYSRAEMELLRVAHYSDYPGVRDRAYFFLGLCELYVSRWDESREAFHTYFAKTHPSRAEAVDSLLDRSHTMNHKSQTTARRLSTLAPGLGQLYAGAYRQAVVTMAVNLLTARALWGDLSEGQVVDPALLVHWTIFERYYRGARTNADRAARLHNERIDGALARDVWQHLLKESGDTE
jgi:tetratricopeptide (TPR) repeat protein